MIHRRIDGSRPEAIGYGKEEQHPVGAGEGKSKQSQHCHGYGYNNDPFGMKPFDHPGAQQRRNDSHKGYGHGHITGIR